MPIGRLNSCAVERGGLRARRHVKTATAAAANALTTVAKAVTATSCASMKVTAVDTDSAIVRLLRQAARARIIGQRPL